jgi:hypothetical protein
MLPHGKHVVFFMVQELGHLSPAFDVGRRLITQGYNVSFWCTSKGRAIVLKAGFDAVDMLDDDLDERALIRSSCFNGRMEKELKLKSVTKIIADCQLRMLGLLAWKLDLDFMICSTSLPVPTYDPDQGYPSVRSSHGPFETDQERRDFNTFMVETFPSEFDLELLQYAKDCGFPAYYLRVQPWGIPWMTCVPEVILCPESFEFPHTRSSSMKPKDLDGSISLSPLGHVQRHIHKPKQSFLSYLQLLRNTQSGLELLLWAACMRIFVKDNQQMSH